MEIEITTTVIRRTGSIRKTMNGNTGRKTAAKALPEEKEYS